MAGSVISRKAAKAGAAMPKVKVCCLSGVAAWRLCTWGGCSEGDSLVGDMTGSVTGKLVGRKAAKVAAATPQIKVYCQVQLRAWRMSV